MKYIPNFGTKLEEFCSLAVDFKQSPRSMPIRCQIKEIQAEQEQGISLAENH